MDVFADFLAAFDLAPETNTAAAGDQASVGRPIAPDQFYVELEAYGFSVESPNAQFCARMHHALRAHYGLTEQQLTWFSMHAELDADHGDEFRNYARRAADAPDGLSRMRDQTLALCEVTKRVWDGVGAWR